MAPLALLRFQTLVDRLNGPPQREEFYEPDMLAVLDIALHDVAERVFETSATPLGFSADRACAARVITAVKRILADGVFDFRGDVDILLRLGM